MPHVGAAGRPLRLAVLSDFPEEDWPSMDLCAEMLLAQAQAQVADRLAAQRVCPPFRRRLGALPILGRRSWAHNADRFLNRLVYFPRYLRRRRAEFDLYHLVDHSYSQLVLEIPGARTGVFCHDVDTFRCLVEPEREPRPGWFRWMMRRVLRGFQQAAVVFHTTQVVKNEILRHGLIAAEKLVQAPMGRSAEYCDEPAPDAVAGDVLARLQGRPYLLHVGSCIPRKRIEFLLELFAALRTRLPELHLVKVGGTWSAAQEERIRRLELQPALVHLQRGARSTLAVLYRRAALVLLPSEAEGFGIPVVEALACGAPLLISDLPALREVGGQAVTYAPVGDLEYWREQALRILNGAAASPPRALRLAQAEPFTWERHAGIITNTYLELGA
jgi:glycosyltransferase involved in cell wall biosynthesis